MSPRCTDLGEKEGIPQDGEQPVLKRRSGLKRKFKIEGEAPRTAAAPHTPPFRADHVGSLLRPPDLKKARQDRSEERISAQELQPVEDAATRRVVTQQERVGLQSITDGEFRREDCYTHFFVLGLVGL